MVGPVAFPLAKLAVVTVRQAGRPLAGMVEKLANRSSAFRFSVKIAKRFQVPAETFATDKPIRRVVCLPLAQFYHYYEVKMKLGALNLGVGKVQPQCSKVENVIAGLF